MIERDASQTTLPLPGTGYASPSAAPRPASLRVEGNKPLLLLNEPEGMWLVETGKVDVFVVGWDGKKAAGPGSHLLRAEAGEALFGIDPGAGDCGLALLARGAPGTTIRFVSRDEPGMEEDAGTGPTAQQLVERWVTNLAGGIRTELAPQVELFLEPSRQYTVAPDAVATPRDGVVWVMVAEGDACLLGRGDLMLPKEPDVVPLPQGLWLRAASPARICGYGFGEVRAREQVWRGLALFHALVLRAFRSLLDAEETAERQRLRQKAEAREAVVQHAWRQIGTLLTADAQVTIPLPRDGDALLAACGAAAEAMGIRVEPSRGPAPRTVAEGVRRIANASGVRTRTVALRGRWWHADSGPLVATIDELNRPVALLPCSDESYELYDPVAGTRTRVTAEVARQLGSFATAFYRPFPQRALTTLELVRFGLRGARRDLRMVVVMGALVALLGLVTPLAIGYIFDTLIPQADRGQLVQIGLLLAVVALATAAFDMVRGVALVRIESRMGAEIQAAVWDRLLNLPAPFFRGYTAGDLGQRAMGINALRGAVSGQVVGAVLAGIFSLANLGLLFYLDAGLATGALLLVLIGVAATGLSGYLQLKHQRAVSEMSGLVSGVVLQLINGMAKLRVAGVEGRAFALWADVFSRQKKLDYRARKVRNGLTVFNTTYPVLTTMGLIAMIAISTRSTLSTGTFLAFNSAFLQLLGAALQLSTAVTSVLAVVPLYERATPILHTLPEVTAAKADPGELKGDIEVKHVSFRYKQDGPPVLRDVSLHIRPGEFVALVGGSGSGKSTLLRLLLGFETPESGAIYYDGRDLSQLDVRSVRSQIGVVLQQGRLLSGSILENIVGSSPLTLDDAMEAARMAGLDDDIRQMPMGMHTFITEGGGTLSGGQRQRLLIAQAIVKRPRIVFFDEATSALDNRTQRIVSESLERLQATRVVIAHRLSTIIHADRIFVLDAGRLVQSGSYDELIDQPGLFADLAKRQLI